MSPVSRPTEVGRGRLDRLAENLADIGIAFERGQMFGCPGVRQVGKGKFFVTVWADDLVFKLEGAHHAAALALSGAHLLEPMPGRPMKQWVVVPPSYADRDVEFGTAAARFVG